MKTIRRSLFALMLPLSLLMSGMAACSAPFPEGDLFDLLIIQKALETAPCSVCYLFVTPSAMASGNLGGVSGADAICAAAKNSSFASLPGTDYRALLVDQVPTRTACTSANCSGQSGVHSGWVLHANSTYKRANDNAVVMTTNANGIAVFPLSTTMDTTGGTIPAVWTGLFTDWTTVAGSTCSSWQSTAGNGSYGDTNAVNNTAIDAGSFVCSDNFEHLVCVQY